MFIRKFASIAALSLSAIASLSYAGSAHAIQLNYDPGHYRDNAVTNQGVFSQKVNDKNYTTIDFNKVAKGALPGNDQVTYSFSQGSYSSQSGTKTGIFSNGYAPSGANAQKNKSNYLAVFLGNDVTIQSKKGNIFDYFGFDAGALSIGNTLTFYNGNNLIQKYDFKTLNSMATVIDKSQNGGQKNGFFEFLSTNSTDRFDKIVISQTDKTGGFESDNHTFRTAKVPEPSLTLGMLAISGGMLLLKRKNQKALNLG